MLWAQVKPIRLASHLRPISCLQNTGIYIPNSGSLTIQNGYHSSSSKNSDRLTQYDRRGDFREQGRDRDFQKKTRTVRFNYDTASDQAKLAITDLISQVRELSPNFKVQIFNTDTKQMKRVGLTQIINKLNFREEGVTLSFAKDGLPVIKVVKIHEMLRTYSDTLAKRKEAELLELGSSAALRSARQKREAERKKSALKVVALSWAISPKDLQNQKYNEIAKRVQQGKSFVIYLGDKSSISSTRHAEKESLLGSLTGTNTIRTVDGDLDIEIMKREKLVDKVREILVQLDCPFEESGSVDARAAFNCSPKKLSLNTTETQERAKIEQNDREAKRKRRLEREKKEKEQKAKLEEDDLDSLYSFKVED